MTRDEGPWIYLVVGGPNDGITVEMRDGRDSVRLRKPMSLVFPADLEPFSIEETTTLYTVRPIHDRFGYTGKSILAPASISDDEAMRRLKG